MSEEEKPAPVMRSAIVPYHMGPGGNHRAVNAAERAAVETGDISTMHGDELALARFFQRQHQAAQNAHRAQQAVFDAP